MEYVAEYYTGLEPIKLKEYGRNVQMIAQHIAKEEDDEKRSRMAKGLVELMKQINPAVRENQDYLQRIWNHLYYITDFKLEIPDPVYPVPTPESMHTDPLPVDYSENRIGYRHYGKNIELLIKQAIAIEDPTEKQDVVIYLGKVMKRFYSTWNKENVDDEIIVQQIKRLSQNQLDIDLAMVKEKTLFDSMLQATGPSNESKENHHHHRGKKKGGQKKRRK